MITFHPTIKKISCLLVIAAVHISAHAVDISDDPLNTYSAATATDVKPNLMFVLDNSGSMDFAYMPDDALNFSGEYGFVSNHCNGVYYNPNTTYTPPIKADGTSYPNASFTAALRNGYDTSSGTVDLSSHFEAINGPNYDNYTDHSGFSAQAAFYYTYHGSQTAESQKTYTDTGSTFYKECNSDIGDSPGKNVFTKVIVSNTSSPKGGDEKQNFANWYSYYRTRLLMMKTASGVAFKDIDSRFRVGFMTINSNGNKDFLNIGDFDSATKTSWYDALYSNNTNGGTPLRRALADAGRMYAGKLTTRNGVTVTDPVQYSCQQNYTILSTDGFWNGNTPYKLDGSTSLGNQDAGLSRPYYDGASAQLQTRTSNLQQRTGHLQKRSGRRSSWSNVSSCDPNSTDCRYDWGAWTNVSSCTVQQSSGSGNWTIVNGTDCGYTSWTNWSNVSSCTPVARSTDPNYTVAKARECQTDTSEGGSEDSLADVAAYYYNTDLRDSAATGADDTGTCTGPIVDGAGNHNDLCANNVPANGRDVATTQHMTTFSLGLGVRGRMVYSPTYLTDTSGDFYSVSRGLTAGSGVCSWQSSGACNWPIPGSDQIENVDDLWHAAVNGHGTYFSATDPDTLATGLKNALSTIINTPRPGTAAAAASSNPNVSATDNYVFSSSYKSVEWYGELIRQRIGTDGVLSAQNWSAMRLLDCATTTWQAGHDYLPDDAYRQGSVCYTVTAPYTSSATFGSTDTNNTAVVHVDETAETPVAVVPQTSRTIYTANDDRTALVPFQWTAAPVNGETSGLSAAQEAYFSQAAITYNASTKAGLTQFCPEGTAAADSSACLSAADQTSAAGEQLVKFLRGDRSHEGGYFRRRIHVLGDIVSSEARYVQGSLFDYSDTNYSAFKTLRASRAGRVYVGSNDGMLHAIDAETGQEAWAYIPSMVLPNLYKLADRSYSSKHQYFVDNSPETGDICPNAPTSTCAAGEWKTILVGGLNHGGKGYYALDITDPSVTPKLLWEFTDSNLGDSYGNPRITKLENGTWVVLLSSGYNNADGVSRLFVLNANTGAKIMTISTGVESGFARISAHVLQPAVNNTTVAAYGGDTEGNLWRFDINGDIGASGNDAQRLVTFTDGSDHRQPITVKPLQATINGKPVVFVGTGRFLGTSDIEDTSQQSFYAVKDNLDATTYGSPRVAANNFVQQTLTKAKCPDGTPETICIPGQDVILSSSNPVDWNTKNGWYMDFANSGERSSTDPSLALGTLLFTTISPQASSASACGASNDSAASYLYALDYLTGGAVSGANGVTGISLGSSLVTRPVMIEQADGTVRALIRTSSGASSGTDLGDTRVIAPPVKPPSAGATRRVSWRLLNAR